jgi:uncharacterized membrane protein
MKKEIWFGLSILLAIVVALFAFMPAPADMTNGHLGLLMLALVVVAIMLGFPTAFTLMGMACCSPGSPSTAATPHRPQALRSI